MRVLRRSSFAAPEHVGRQHGHAGNGPGADRGARSSPCNPVFVDIETRSAADIRLGGRLYAHHPATEIVSVVVLLDSSVIVWVPGRADVVDAGDLWPAEVTPRLPISIYVCEELPIHFGKLLHTERAFSRHNAYGFDAHVWRAKGLPAPWRWIDTLPLARAAGLPGGSTKSDSDCLTSAKTKRGRHWSRRSRGPPKRDSGRYQYGTADRDRAL